MSKLMKYEKNIKSCQKDSDVEILRLSITKPKLLKQKKIPLSFKYSSKKYA